LTSTDLELELNARIQLVGDNEFGETTVPAKKFVDICRSLPAEADVHFSLDNERVTIRSGRSRFTLATLPAAEFPKSDEDVQGEAFAVAAAQFRRVIDRDRKSTRLNSSHVSISYAVFCLQKK